MNQKVVVDALRKAGLQEVYRKHKFRCGDADGFAWNFEVWEGLSVEPGCEAGRFLAFAEDLTTGEKVEGPDAGSIEEAMERFPWKKLLAVRQGVHS